MPVVIDSDCINCDMCVPECPNDAIAMGKEHYVVDVNKCTECEGFYDEPACIPVCPIECMTLIPDA
ncbi:YfhL family 4Fe-4S dicluster ferredoxin [Pseudidiomarina marina]|uniref:Ferredoxin n=1 Tax=Pseudidiomarina marina TaxID=502366 RepID=A0A432YDQ8_9GAMM|nr:YfhL family 4Fe-4S dicluster ferredoxin [Pseudidiomarina marina]PHR65180.1 MAG: ferredoxin [Idiomarina sp.]RUO59114.1 ferredoxin [Pseudidiomarina marina]